MVTEPTQTLRRGVKSPFILLVLAIAPLVLNSCKESRKEEAAHKSTVGICFAGDVMLSRGVKAKIARTGNEYLLSSIRPFLQEYKCRFVNLECPITGLNDPPDKPYCFRADSSEVGVLTFAGITHASLANNHIDDQTAAGATDTYRILNENGIAGIGLKRRGDTLCEPAEVNVGSRKVAVFGALGIPMNLSNIWYARDSLFLKSVQKYKLKNPASFVICYVHWGIEYRQLPSFDQTQLADQLIDLGADMIIGHHPHVIESISYYKGRPIFYSLGNLIFDQADPDTKKGIMVGLTFNDSSYQTELIPYDIREFRPVPITQDKKNGFKESLLNISDGIILTDDENGWTLRERKTDELAASRGDIYGGMRFSPLVMKDSYFEGEADLIKLKSLPGYKLAVYDRYKKTTDNLYIPYPVYRFYTCDINNDGRIDILLGVVKSTHFDPVVRKRLFIFRIDSSRLSPLWLGSRVCRRLVDFKPVHLRRGNRILTVESEADILFSDGLYKWDNFGLKLIGYENENETRSSAYEYFDRWR